MKRRTFLQAVASLLALRGYPQDLLQKPNHHLALSSMQRTTSRCMLIEGPPRAIARYYPIGGWIITDVECE